MSREFARSRSPIRSQWDASYGSMSGRSGHVYRIIVKNLPYDVKWSVVKDLFRKEVGDVMYARVIEGPNGRSKGIAVVEFKSKELVDKAIERMHKYKMGDRSIVVREERDHDRILYSQADRSAGGMMDERGIEMDFGQPGMMNLPRGGMDLSREFDPHNALDIGVRGFDFRGAPGLLGAAGMGGDPSLGFGTGFGSGLVQPNAAAQSDIAPVILDQLGIEGPITNHVFVANLDYEVSRAKVIEVFSLAGNVVHVELKEDRSGKSRGMAIVEFESAFDAVQAVSLFHGQILFDRKMSVRIDNKSVEDRPMSNLPSGLKSIGMGLANCAVPVSNLKQSNQLGGLGNVGSGGFRNENIGLECGVGDLGILGSRTGLGLGQLGACPSGASRLGTGHVSFGGRGFGVGQSTNLVTEDLGVGPNLSGADHFQGAAGLMGNDIGSRSGFGPVGVAGYDDVMRSGGYEPSGNRLFSVGRVSRFNDYLDNPNRADFDLDTRPGLGIATSIGMLDNGRGIYDIGGGSDIGAFRNRGVLDIPAQSRFDVIPKHGGIEANGRLGYDSVQNVRLPSDCNDGLYDRPYDSGMRLLGGFNNAGHGMIDHTVVGDMSTGSHTERVRPGQEGCIVSVKNLPYSMTWQDLRDRFRDIGDVRYADMIMDNGRPCGEALVRFSRKEDAMRAVTVVDGTRMDGRIINLTLGS